MRWLWLAGSLGLAAALIAFFESPRFYDEICGEANQAGYKECADYHVTVIFLWRLVDELQKYNGAITATATIVIAGLTWFLKVSTHKMWEEARKSADTAKRTVEEMETTAQRQLRAYLAIADGSVYFIRDDVLRAHIRIVNSGQTPAHDVNPAIYSEIRVPKDDKVFPPVTPMPHKQPIAPNSEWTVGYEIGLSPEESQAVYEQRKLVYVWGRVTYRDIFGRSQEVNFRLRNVVRETTAEGRLVRWYYYPEEEGNSAT
jgi:hypothetical protein